MRALANCKGITYAEAHAICSMYGRDREQAMCVSLFARACKSQGLQVHAYGQSADSLELVWHCEAEHINEKRLNVSDACKLYANHVCIALIRGHVFAIRYVKIVDTFAIYGGTEVQAVFCMM